MDITLVQKNIGGRSRMVVRMGKAGTERARQGRFATLREAGLTLTGVPEEMGGVWQSGGAVNTPDRRDISHPRPGRSFGGVGGDHASHRAGAVA
jgi:hypothetical protein